MLGAAGDLRPADDIIRVVQGVGDRVGATQITQIDRSRVDPSSPLEIGDLHHALSIHLGGRDDAIVIDARDRSLELSRIGIGIGEILGEISRALKGLAIRGIGNGMRVG